MLYCAHCGYNLTGVCTQQSPRGNCPECGTAFDRDALVKAGGVIHPPLTRPLLLLLVGPTIYTVMVAICVPLVAGGNSTHEELVVGLLVWGGLACFAVTVVTSFYTGRRMARRLANRPPQSQPNLGSVMMTIIFTVILSAAQVVLAFCTFFVGCLAAMQ